MTKPAERAMPSGNRTESTLRPQLRPGTPVLQRPGAVQVGMDCPDAVLISPASTALVSWLHLLDGRREWPDLLRSARRLGLATDEACRVLDRLLDVGLVRRAISRTPSGRVRLIGAGRLGRAIAGQLATAGLTAIELVDDDPVDRALYPRRFGYGRQSAALEAELLAERPGGSGPPPVSVGPPWSVIAESAGEPEARRPRPDATVVASDRLEVERMFTDTLLRDDQPHLVVRGAGDGVVVGPLVLPGRTACVRCTDLVRRELDPDWPVLLSQLARTTATLSEPQLGWAAAMVVAQLLALLTTPDGPWPESAGASLELGRDHRLTRRSWPRHPGCGCSWPLGAVLAS